MNNSIYFSKTKLSFIDMQKNQKLFDSIYSLSMKVKLSHFATLQGVVLAYSPSKH